jgi:hypothetical protein
MLMGEEVLPAKGCIKMKGEVDAHDPMLRMLLIRS